MEPIDMKIIYTNLNQMDLPNKFEILVQLQLTEFSDLPSLYDQIKLLQRSTFTLNVTQIQLLLGVSKNKPKNRI